MLKTVVVEANKGFKIYGKNIRPGKEIILNIRQIFGLFALGKIKVYEVLPNGERVQLNKSNYDKINHSSVSSVDTTEVNHTEPIVEGIPTHADESSVPVVEESTGPVESEVPEKKEEPVIEEEEPNTENSEINNEEESANPDNGSETENDESSVIDEELVNDTNVEEVEDVEESAQSTNTNPEKPNNTYNVPKKANKYKKHH